MKLSRLEISSVRNLSSVIIEDLAKVNIFYGANGAGKTSILEAIHILGLARSFRSVQLQPVIQFNQEACTVFGQVERDRGLPVAVGVKRSRRGRFHVRIGGQDEKGLVRLAEVLPIQLINPTAYSLIEGGPKQRRQFIDWGVFHVEHSFYLAWQRMQRCIKQRNSILRAGNARLMELSAWNQELLDTAALIDRARESYIQSFIPVFMELLSRLVEVPGLSVCYYRGWDMELELATVLDASYERDCRRGITHCGPHRADLKMQVNGIDAAQVLSRGQQKLVVYALRLAQCQLLGRTTGKKCLLLIDDLPAEIDQEHQKKLCVLLESLDVQLFLTCVSPDDLIQQGWNRSNQMKVFHVKHGEVREAVAVTA